MIRRRHDRAVAPGKIALAALLLSAAGCTTLTVTSRDGTIAARGMLGATLETLPLAPVAITTRGFGIYRTRYAIGAGWHAETGVYVPAGSDDCRIVLIGNTSSEVAQLVAVLSHAGTDPASICAYPHGESE